MEDELGVVAALEDEGVGGVLSLYYLVEEAGEEAAPVGRGVGCLMLW